MSKELITTNDGVNVALNHELSDEAKAFARASKADNSLRAYRAQWSMWQEWANRNGATVLPASPAAVASWLSSRANGTAGHVDPRAGRGEKPAGPATLSTIRIAVAAIKAAHTAAGLDFDSRASAIKLVLAGMARVKGRLQDQARPFRRSLLDEILAHSPADPRGARDAALLSLAYLTATRRSEVVKIDWAEHRDGDSVLTIDAAGLHLRFARSKTSADGEEVVVPRNNFTAPLIAAIERWIALAAIELGTPVVRSIRKGGHIAPGYMHHEAPQQVLRAAVRDYRLRQGVNLDAAAAEAMTYSGHSFRVGVVVDLAEAGADTASIATVTRHRSSVMPERYASQASKRARSPFNKITISTV